MTVLSVGSAGPEVGNLQRFLNTFGFRDDADRELRVDEDFGKKTESALARYQRSLDLPDFRTGFFDEKTRRYATAGGFVRFIQARNFFRRWKPPLIGEIDAARREIRHIVIHTMESSEKPGTAENVARWFANELAPKHPAPRASAHYNIDGASVVQSVRDEDIAWGAPGKYPDGAYVNDHTLHIEHAGLARQSEAEWADGASTLILWHSARLVRHLALRYQVPVCHVEPAGLIARNRGFTGHHDLSKAFGGTHWDPGPFFPWTRYLELVRASEGPS